MPIVPSNIALLLADFAMRKVYGSITIKFEAGKIVLIVKEEKAKP